MSTQFQFTSESVSPGHPDKLCDQLSDTVLDSVLKQDKNARVACEVLVKGKKNESGKVVIAGEISSSSSLDFETEIRDVINDIGYNSDSIQRNPILSSQKSTLLTTWSETLQPTPLLAHEPPFKIIILSCTPLQNSYTLPDIS